MHIPPTPDTNIDFLWWAFNGVLLLLIGLAKNDLSAIKNDGRKNREMQEKNDKEITERRAICEERHKRLDYEIVEMKEKMK